MSLQSKASQRFLALIVVCLLGARSYAAPLLSGATILAPAEPDPTGGIVQAGTGVAVPFASPAGPGQFSGTLTTTVINGDPSNALGGLTFTYRITNNAVSLASLERLTNLNFTGFLTDVSYQIPAAGVAPTSVDRDASGSTVGWSFSPLGSGVINPGSASALVVIQTNAHFYAPISANVLDGSIAMAPSFGPVVPEPTALSLLGIGLVGLRRRRAN